MKQVIIRHHTRGEFELMVIISELFHNVDMKLDDVEIMEFEGDDALLYAEKWCADNDYEIVANPYGQ